ncbi:class I SAM-dependent methyltransferase [Hyphobacterium indicum]|uniref:class I SAM-dependent methyltransferase n=1 Tax=Hyphobacterium indicum TaxID=2162714 RepID=UPI000D649B40|nr:class I SAM-dependent methyltransferase [Hyphobacterium indicum]
MNDVTTLKDTAAAETFAEEVSTIVNHGAIAVMMSIGHRLGLFETLAGRAPSTSQEIAAEAGLAERYVREWLAAMVTGGMVRYDAVTARYHLPAEHAACLVRGAPYGNLAVFAQHVALLGQMQERALTLFETGEGTRYDDYPCFHQIMAEDSEQSVAAALIDSILPLAPDLEGRLREGIDVLDAGCGRGLALIELALAFPESRFVGMDLCEDAIAFARLTARNSGLANVTFEVRDLTGYCEPDRFDLIASFDAVHDQKDPAALVRGLRKSLKPGGVYLMQDIGGSARLENNLDFPMASLLYAVSCLHCTPVSLGQGGLGLGTMWGWETAEATLRDAGFGSVERHVLPHDPLNVWFVSRV